MTTIKRHNIFVVGLSLIIAAGFWIVPLRSHKAPVFSYKIFKTASGWGYDILVNDTLQIHQEFVPVIADRKSFPERGHAEKVAQLVLGKLRSGENPAISRAELETICCANK